MIQIDIPMPTNCEECDERGIRQLLWCRLIHSGCANCGRHPNCPLKEVPIGEWIPVTKQLPKENTWVLCWYEYFRYGDYECMQETYGVGFYDSYGHWGGDVSGHKSKAIAWMPLPKPYVKEQQGENT